MVGKPSAAGSPRFEHSVPFFWPMAPWIELGEEAAEIFQRNLDFAIEEEKEEFDLKPVWASQNEILYDLNTMQLRDFSDAAARSNTKVVPTVIDAPMPAATRPSPTTPRARAWSETLQSNGTRRALCMGWKSATDQMKDYNIDIYLAEINAIVDDLGGQINLIGLCQGGWMAAMFAAHRDAGGGRRAARL